MRLVHIYSCIKYVSRACMTGAALLQPQLVAAELVAQFELEQL